MVYRSSGISKLGGQYTMNLVLRPGSQGLGRSGTLERIYQSRIKHDIHIREVTRDFLGCRKFESIQYCVTNMY